MTATTNPSTTRASTDGNGPPRPPFTVTSTRDLAKFTGAAVPGLPDGHLRAVWADRRGSSPESHEGAHNALGSAVLLALVALAIAAIRNERPAH